MKQSFVVIGLCVAAVGVAEAQTIVFKRLDAGATKKLGGYAPQRLKLDSAKPADLKKAPAGLESPKFGVIRLGNAEMAQSYIVVIDERKDGSQAIFIDRNRDGDLTNDPAVTWNAVPYKAQDGTEFKRYVGDAALIQSVGDQLMMPAINFYKFDKADLQRAELKDTLLYYSDWATEGELKIGTKTYKAMLSDMGASGDFRGKEPTEKTGSGINLLIDVNGNGKFERRGEQYDVRKPFNIGGTTYEIARMNPSGMHFEIVKSTTTVAEIMPPPDMSVGTKILSFKAADMDGKAISFPSSYKGKLVMLDFWATWCGPCKVEIPGLVKAYEKFHGRGFEILGISLDQENMVDKVREFTKGASMPWAQVYDGKYWQAEIAQVFVIQSIPATFLVDGDTGEIVAAGNDLRGDALAATLERALAKKFGSK